MTETLERPATDVVAEALPPSLWVVRWPDDALFSAESKTAETYYVAGSTEAAIRRIFSEITASVPGPEIGDAFAFVVRDAREIADRAVDRGLAGYVVYDERGRQTCVWSAR